MSKRTIEINDTLDDHVQSAIEQVRDLLHEWLDENHDPLDGEPDTPCLHNDLDYSGRVHEIVDGSVPIYTAEINDLFYLYGSELESAFDDAGIGDKDDDNWPMGWKAAAIYCYIDQQVSEWYHDDADDEVAEWWSKNRPAVVACRDHSMGQFDGLIVSDTGDVPEDYSGSVLHISDHGNATLYACDDGDLEEIDAIV